MHFALESGNLGAGASSWKYTLWEDQKIWEIEPQCESSFCGRFDIEKRTTTQKKTRRRQKIRQKQPLKVVARRWQRVARTMALRFLPRPTPRSQNLISFLWFFIPASFWKDPWKSSGSMEMVILLHDSEESQSGVLQTRRQRAVHVGCSEWARHCQDTASINSDLFRVHHNAIRQTRRHNCHLKKKRSVHYSYWWQN